MKLVEFRDLSYNKSYVNPEFVSTVRSYGSVDSAITMSNGSVVYVSGAPADVVMMLEEA